MRRYTFVGRLGSSDNAPVPLPQPNSTEVAIDFLGAHNRLEFGLGTALDVLRKLGRRPPDAAIDFAILAALVNAADTHVSRPRNAQNGWTREMDVIVPVRDVAVWQPVATYIGYILRFLTGDHWRVFFRERPASCPELAEAPTVLPLTHLDEVALLSGGLDSLVGAVDRLGSGVRPLFISHYWDSQTSKAQAAVIFKLEQRFGAANFHSIRVRLGFNRYEVATGESENTQRGRSFLFFALAALAASSLGQAAKVLVPENGLIGLNVPLDPLRLGALSTRTTHPHYMASMNRLFAAIGLEVTLQNPYRHLTKGEMIAGCADLPFLRSVVPLSMSCSAPDKARYHGLSPRHCGSCVPCLIRRASLLRGLGSPDVTEYLVSSLTARPLDSARAEGEHVRSFQWMSARLASNPAGAAALAQIPGPLNDDPSERASYVDVFRRGILEVDALLQPVTARPH